LQIILLADYITCRLYYLQIILLADYITCRLVNSVKSIDVFFYDSPIYPLI
jgi:hypothetical protein